MAQRAPARTVLDHLLLGVADLERGIEWVERRTGTRAAIGGSHPGRGTRNALVSLGECQYLEIIAPDPAQQGAEAWLPRLRTLPEPRLVWWAAVAGNLAGFSTEVRARGLDVSGPHAGSRARPDGAVLEWATLTVAVGFAANEVDPIPFFIEWAPDARHPSQGAPAAGRLVALEFDHPEPERLTATLQAIGIDAAVKPSASVRIAATLDTPRGTIVIA